MDTELHVTEQVTPTKEVSAENTAKLTRSVNRKAVVEKFEFVIPAEDHGTTNHNAVVEEHTDGPNGVDKDGDAIMET